MDFSEEEMFTSGEFGRVRLILKYIELRSEHLTVNLEPKAFLFGRLYARWQKRRKTDAIILQYF